MVFPRKFNFNGNLLTIKQIANKVRINPKTISERIRLGKTIMEAIKPISKQNNNPVTKLNHMHLQQGFCWDYSNEIGY